MTENQRLSRGRYGRSILVKTNERLAAALALAKELLGEYCRIDCIRCEGAPGLIDHSTVCLDFQQRIKEIEEQG